MTTMVSPQPELTSTSTENASMPLTAAEQTLASMGKFYGRVGNGLQSGFSGFGGGRPGSRRCFRAEMDYRLNVSRQSSRHAFFWPCQRRAFESPPFHPVLAGRAHH